MQIEIRSRDFTVTDAIRSYVLRRLGFALDHFQSHIRSVKLCLGDLNGPKGGEDKFCRVLINTSSGHAVIEEVDEDLYRAIGRAADRAATKVSREVGRASRSDHPHFILYEGAA